MIGAVGVENIDSVGGVGAREVGATQSLDIYNIRDLAYANGPYKKKRAENQKKHRDNPSMKGKDWDHRTSSFRSVAYNRGGGGNGTKNE